VREEKPKSSNESKIGKVASEQTPPLRHTSSLEGPSRRGDGKERNYKGTDKRSLRIRTGKKKDTTGLEKISENYSRSRQRDARG